MRHILKNRRGITPTAVAHSETQPKHQHGQFSSACFPSSRSGIRSITTFWIGLALLSLVYQLPLLLQNSTTEKLNAGKIEYKSLKPTPVVSNGTQLPDPIPGPEPKDGRTEIALINSKGKFSDLRLNS